MTTFPILRRRVPRLPAFAARFAVFAMFLLLLGVVRPACASIIGFDDVTTGEYRNVPSGYQGLQWSNFQAYDYRQLAPFYSESGYAHGVVSPNYFAYDTGGNPCSFSASTLFTFNSVYMTAAWRNGLKVLVNGYRNNTVIYAQTVLVDSVTPVLYTFNWIGVDKVEFTPSGGTDAGYGANGAQIVFDNLTVNEPTHFSIGTQDGAANARALVTGFVTLRAPAPAGGATLPLTSDNAIATVPATVFVPEGASYATFPIQINSIPSVNKANLPVGVTFGTQDSQEASETSFTAYPAGIARADSFVQDGAGADSNFGTAPTLLVSADGAGGSGSNRDTYLRFKFDGFRSVTKATLRVYGSVSDGAATPVGVYGVATNGWEQDTLTFNNRPALTGLVKTFTASGTPTVKYDINVTSYVQSALAKGKTTVSLALHLPSAATGTVSIVSKETIDLKPQLILQGQ